MSHRDDYFYYPPDKDDLDYDDPNYKPTTHSTKTEEYYAITNENCKHILTKDIISDIMGHKDTKILKLKKAKEAEEAKEAKEAEDDLAKILEKNTLFIKGEEYYGPDKAITYLGLKGLETYPVSDIVVIENKRKRKYPFIYNINEVISADPPDWGRNISIHNKGYKVLEILPERRKVDKNSRSVDDLFDISFI